MAAHANGARVSWTRRAVLTGVLLTELAGAFVMIDLFVGVSLLLPWLTGCLALGLALGLLGTVGVPTKMRVALLVSFALILIAVRWANWDSRKTFLRDLYSIHSGMTRTQVDGVMRTHMRESTHAVSPGAPPSSGGDGVRDDIVIYRHTNEGRDDGNADWGIVKFELDKVVSVDFSPD
jgi:hypothetical protein